MNITYLNMIYSHISVDRNLQIFLVFVSFEDPTVYHGFLKVIFGCNRE